MPSLGIHLSNYLCNQQFRSFPLSIKERPNRWRLSCERLLAGRKEPCSVQRRSTAQRTNERFPPAALGSFKRWLGGAASHAAVDQPDRPRNTRRGPPDLRKPAQALGLRQSARGVGPRARAAGTRRAGRSEEHTSELQ